MDWAIVEREAEQSGISRTKRPINFFIIADVISAAAQLRSLASCAASNGIPN